MSYKLYTTIDSLVDYSGFEPLACEEDYDDYICSYYQHDCNHTKKYIFFDRLDALAITYNISADDVADLKQEFLQLAALGDYDDNRLHGCPRFKFSIACSCSLPQ